MNPNINKNINYLKNLESTIQNMKQLDLIYRNFNPYENLNIINSQLLQQMPRNSSLNLSNLSNGLNHLHAMTEEEKKNTIMSFYNLNTNMMPEYYKQANDTLNSLKSLSEQMDPYKTITSSSIQSNNFNNFNQTNLMISAQENLNFLHQQFNSNFKEENINSKLNSLNNNYTQSIYAFNKLLTDSNYNLMNNNNNNSNNNSKISNSKLSNNNINQSNSSNLSEDNKFLSKKRKLNSKDIKIIKTNDSEEEIIENNKKSTNFNFKDLSSKNVNCEVCSKEFKSEMQLKTHLKTHKVNYIIETKDEEMCFQCEHGQCNLKFKTKGRKLMHHNKQEIECKNEKTSLIKLISYYKAVLTNLNKKSLNFKKNFLENYFNLSESLEDNEYFSNLCGNSFD